MTVGLIWAQAANGVIGAEGAIPWRLPEDLALFRQITTGSAVVMGRVTWESLPPRFRPLPDRRNLVLSRRPAWTTGGAEVIGSIEEALATVRGAGDDPLWVIGGAAVYASALPVAERAVITELEQPFEGDCVAPELPASWTTAAVLPVSDWHESSTGLRFRVRVATARPEDTADDLCAIVRRCLAS